VKHINCPQEAVLTKAVRTGNLETSLTIHAATCTVCREIIQASSWMQALARGSESNPILPDAGLLWWRARLSEKQAKAEKAQDVLDCVEITSAAAISVVLGGWVAWNWYAIQRLIAWISAGANSWATAYSMPFFFSPIIAVLCLAALVLAYPILVDE
jgi:hypothetical protein